MHAVVAEVDAAGHATKVGVNGDISCDRERSQKLRGVDVRGAAVLVEGDTNEGVSRSCVACFVGLTNLEMGDNVPQPGQ
jgi:hypothetical protein